MCQEIHRARYEGGRYEVRPDRLHGMAQGTVLSSNDVSAGGFTLGKITDFEAEPCDEGDDFVVAPDGSRAGLVWEVYDPPYFQEVRSIETGRWESGA